MQAMALNYIYVIAGLQIFGSLVFLGEKYVYTNRDVVIGIILNTLEAAAIFYLLCHSTFEYATLVASIVWMSEVAMIVISIRTVGSTILFTPRRIALSVALTAITVLTARLLAFA